MTAKITSKGQVTIPKRVREVLGSDYIEFQIDEGRVLIRPVASARGSLAAYADARKRKREEGAWPRAVAEREEGGRDRR